MSKNKTSKTNTKNKQSKASTKEIKNKKGNTNSKSNQKNKTKSSSSGTTTKKKNPITAELKADGRIVFHGRSYNITRDKNLALEPFGKVLYQYGKELFILPEDNQSEQIRRTTGCSRFVAKDFITTQQKRYEESEKYLSVDKYKKTRLKELKKEYPFLKEVDKFALENALIHVDTAYKNFFEGRAGYPKNPSKYKPNGNRYTTNYTNNNIELLKVKGLPYIKLPYLGLVRFVLPKGTAFSDIVPANGRITSVVVKKDGNNYLVSLQIEVIIDKQNPLSMFKPSEICGMDMGLKEFCIYGSAEGERIHEKNKRYINKHAKRLRRLQKSLSRKQYNQKEHKGSKNYYKAKDKVAKEQRKIANQRKDAQHKLSRLIADKYRVFICEDLNIKGLLKNRKLAKQISSVGWGTFLSMVQYKIERKGGIFLKVSRWYPSSKTCTHCGYKNDELQLSDRYWTCPHCHTLINRDENAVDNLIKEGIRLLAEQNIILAA